MEFKLSGIIPLAVKYLVKSEATQSIPERQYVFKHDNVGIFSN